MNDPSSWKWAGKDFILYFLHKHTAATHHMMVTPSEEVKWMVTSSLSKSLGSSQVTTGNAQTPTSSLPKRKTGSFENYWSNSKADLPNKPPHLALQQKVAQGPGWEGGWQATLSLAPMQEPHIVKAGNTFLDQIQISNSKTIGDGGYSGANTDTQRSSSNPNRTFPSFFLFLEITKAAVDPSSKDSALGNSLSLLIISLPTPATPHAIHHPTSAIESTIRTVSQWAKILKPDYETWW